MSLFMNAATFPSSFYHYLPNRVVQRVSTYTALRSDRFTQEAANISSLPIDIALMRSSSISSLDLKEGAEIEFAEVSFLAAGYPRA